MNNKASPTSTNPTKKCRAVFPYFPSLESRLAGEHTVEQPSLDCGSRPNLQVHFGPPEMIFRQWKVCLGDCRIG
jgi:hypothetical protein